MIGLSSYDKYIKRLRQHPEAIILVRLSNGLFTTFGEDATLAAGRCNKTTCGARLIRNHRHFELPQVVLSQSDIRNLFKQNHCFSIPIAYA